MKKVLFTALCLGFLNVCSAQEVTVNTATLIKETQRSSNENHELGFVWWIPVDFWKAVLVNNDNVKPEQAAEMIKVLKDYNLVAVVRGKMGAFAGVTYSSKAELENSISFKSPQGLILKPLRPEQVNDNTKNLIDQMKPLLANMMGNLGQNVQFFVYPAVKDGKVVVDPRGHGTLTIALSGRDYNFQLPLESLLKPKKCPTDRREVPGSWVFCPWHGTKLAE